MDRDTSPLAIEARGLTLELHRRAALLASLAPPDWFFSHLAAAVLWRLPLPVRVLRSALRDIQDGGVVVPARGIDLAVMSPRRGSKARGVRGHELNPGMTAVRTTPSGLRATCPATTWVQLAEVLTVDELVDVGDAIVRIPRRRGMQRGSEDDALGTIAQLQAAMDAGRRRGIGRLRAALPLVRVGSASPSETRIRLACVRAGLPEPELDYDVIAEDGTPIGYTEFAFVGFRLLVESEGDHHRVDRDQWNRDIEKYNACIAAGWDVLRLTAAHVYPSAQPAVTRIRNALVRGGWRP